MTVHCSFQWRVVAACIAFVASAPMEVGAQESKIGTGGISGKVRDELGRSLSGVTVAVGGTDIVAESDDDGVFRLANATVGEMSLRIRRIGFKPDTVRVSVRAGSTAPVEIVMKRLAVELDAVRVVGRQNVSGRMAAFYGRMNRGMGHFLTGEQIEKRNAVNMTDLFRMIPGARVETGGMGRTRLRFRGARNPPLVWLDGTPMYAGEVDLDAFDPRSFAGVEIYSGPSTVPSEFLGNRNISSSGGTIVLWTREGQLRARKRKPGEPSAASIIADLVEQQRVFTAAEVDSPARPDSSDLIGPIYPDSFYNAAVPGKVLTEFVVTQSGQVMMDTFGIVAATHPYFAEAVRRAVKDQRYIPARRGVNNVSQVVQQPFEFVPDSGILRRR